jgi:hypothetical protein
MVLVSSRRGVARRGIVRMTGRRHGWSLDLFVLLGSVILKRFMTGCRMLALDVCSSGSLIVITLPCSYPAVLVYNTRSCS